MFSLAFLRHFAEFFLPATADAGPAEHDPGSAAPIREEYRAPRYSDLAIWFEDLTDDPERVWGVGVAPAQGMDEEWFDAVLGYATASERRYAAPGLLSGVRVKVLFDCTNQYSWVLRQVSQRLGTNPWIRDLSQPEYAEFWYSHKPLFTPKPSITCDGATTNADLTNSAIQTTEN